MEELSLRDTEVFRTLEGYRVPNGIWEWVNEYDEYQEGSDHVPPASLEEQVAAVAADPATAVRYILFLKEKQKETWKWHQELSGEYWQVRLQYDCLKEHWLGRLIIARFVPRELR